MSDHCILKFACQQHFAQYENPDKLRLDNGDYKQLREFLNVNWDDFLKVQDTSVAVSYTHLTLPTNREV